MISGLSSNFEFSHFSDLINKFLNSTSLPIFNSTVLVFELTLSRILFSKNFPLKDLLIKALRCKNSEFDDNPEIIAYLQVKDQNNQNNDEVFVFNDWTFSSSPAVRPFDHPVYDIWLTKCY